MRALASSVALLALAFAACGGPDPATSASTSASATSDSSGSSAGAGLTEGSEASGGASSGSASESATTGSTSTDATTSGDTTSTSAATTSTTGGDPALCDPATFCADATEEGMCRQAIELGGGMFHVWSNLPLDPGPGEDDCHAGVERVVVVQHGNGRTAWSYFNSLQSAAELAGVATTTLILAPHFPAPLEAPDGFHSWSPLSSGWKSGDDSLTMPPLSSFAAVDLLLLDHVLASPHYPALTEVVVTGHSAGGQFTQRYALSTAVDAAPEAAGVDFRFLVLNPSSYLYLDPYRWDGQGTPPAIDFAIPAGSDCDSDYNEYKYGLEAIPAGHYVAEHLGTIPDAYLARDVTYLLGEADTLQDADLDTSCPATLQGEHRLERGQVFAAYLDARFPEQSHGLLTVPGVGHSAGGMYTSATGVAALFP